MTVQTAPVLVFGWGNLSRGDDALGPLLLERLRAVVPATAGVEFLDDYQLQIEHALDLVGRQRVLLVDASLSCRAPFEVTRLGAAQDASFTAGPPQGETTPSGGSEAHAVANVGASFTTHTLSPQALLQVFRDVQGSEPPPCTLLAIRGERFELGEPPSFAALEHLAAALHWAQDWLAIGSIHQATPCMS
jgi:hypothetical protein